MTTTFNYIGLMIQSSHLANQEKLFGHRKHLYNCVAYLSGHTVPALEGLTTAQVVQLFWVEAGAASALAAGPQEEEGIESAIEAFRLRAACNANCAEALRTFHHVLLKIAAPSLARGFRQIWLHHAPLILFPSRRMARGRALAAVRHMAVYAGHGNDRGAADAMRLYLDMVMQHVHDRDVSVSDPPAA